MTDDRDAKISEPRPPVERGDTRTPTEKLELSPGQFRRRASDDPAVPVPERAAVQPTGAIAHAVGTALRYFRRASDAGPTGERLPAVDAATADLRRRVLEAQAAKTTKPGLRRPRRWLW
jgi:hypothetical protein